MDIGFKTRENFDQLLNETYLPDDEIPLLALLKSATQDERLHAMFIAAIQGDVSLVNRLIQTFHLDPKVLAKYNYSLLHCAAQGGHIDTVIALAQTYDLNPKAKTLDDPNLLLCAAIGGHVECVIKLAKIYNLDPCSKNKFGASLLHCAAQGGHFLAIQAFVANFNLDPMALTTEGLSLLHCAAQGGSIETVKKLVDVFHLDPKAITLGGLNLLHCYASYGQVDELLDLAKTYELDIHSVNDLGESVLCYMARCGQVNAMKELTNRININPRIKNIYNANLLFFLARAGEVDAIIDFSKRFEIDPKEKHLSGQSLLHFAAQGGHVDAIRSLAKIFELDPKEKTTGGESLLYYAAVAGQIDAFHKLAIEYGIDIDEINFNRQNSESFDLNMGNLILISQKFYQALIEKGLYSDLHLLLNEDKHSKMFLQWPVMDGVPPFYWACNQGRDDLATIFVQYHAEYNQPEKYLKSDKARDCYDLALVRNHILEAELDFFNSPEKIQAMAKRCQDPERPYLQQDREIILNALIGQHVKAAEKAEISLDNITIGAPENKSESQKTQLLILRYALVLNNEAIASRYTEILTGRGKGMLGMYLSASHPEQLAQNLLLEVLDREFKGLKLEPEKTYLPTLHTENKRLLSDAKVLEPIKRKQRSYSN
jgi:ankyrin repeat protein